MDAKQQENTFLQMSEQVFTKFSFYSEFSESRLSTERAVSRSSDGSEWLHYHSSWPSPIRETESVVSDNPSNLKFLRN